MWRDATRTLVFLAAPDGPPALEVIDVSNPRLPVRVAAWDPRDAGLMPTAGGDDILHSVGVSADGTVAYLSHQLSGLLLADISQLPAISLITPPSAALRWEQPIVMGPNDWLVARKQGNTYVILGAGDFPRASDDAWTLPDD